MRQDRRFHAGEATSARHFARWISRELDWLVTVDPHLHRIATLDEVYSIPTRLVHAAGVVARWIEEHVADPLLVGPDEESAQWVADVAARLGVPRVSLVKTRRGDRDVTVSAPDVRQCAGRTPVLLDDIVSTAGTMVAAVRGIRAGGLPAPVCVAVHAIFAGDALPELQRAGAARVVSTDTVVHATNAMSMAWPLAAAVRELLA
jgi:ribose-phosphate pyrophosphokinase